MYDTEVTLIASVIISHRCLIGRHFEKVTNMAFKAYILFILQIVCSLELN